LLVYLDLWPPCRKRQPRVKVRTAGLVRSEYRSSLPSLFFSVPNRPESSQSFFFIFSARRLGTHRPALPSCVARCLGLGQRFCPLRQLAAAWCVGKLSTPAAPTGFPAAASAPRWVVEMTSGAPESSTKRPATHKKRQQTDALSPSNAPISVAANHLPILTFSDFPAPAPRPGRLTCVCYLRTIAPLRPRRLAVRPSGLDKFFMCDPSFPRRRPPELRR
jgi:hypothetical protein